MGSVYGVRTALRVILQLIEKVSNRFLLCILYQIRIWPVCSTNHCPCLRNALRRWTGRPLQTGEEELPGSFFVSLWVDVEHLIKKFLSVAISFVLRHPVLKDGCLRALASFPGIRDRMRSIACADVAQSVHSILNTDRLSPRARKIYELLTTEKD